MMEGVEALERRVDKAHKGARARGEPHWHARVAHLPPRRAKGGLEFGVLIELALVKPHQEVDRGEELGSPELVKVGLDVREGVDVALAEGVNGPQVYDNTLSAVRLLDRHGHGVVGANARLDEALLELLVHELLEDGPLAWGTVSHRERRWQSLARVDEGRLDLLLVPVRPTERGREEAAALVDHRLEVRELVVGEVGGEVNALDDLVGGELKAERGDAGVNDEAGDLGEDGEGDGAVVRVDSADCGVAILVDFADGRGDHDVEVLRVGVLKREDADGLSYGSSLGNSDLGRELAPRGDTAGLGHEGDRPDGILDDRFLDSVGVLRGGGLGERDHGLGLGGATRVPPATESFVAPAPLAAVGHEVGEGVGGRVVPRSLARLDGRTYELPVVSVDGLVRVLDFTAESGEVFG